MRDRYNDPRFFQTLLHELSHRTTQGFLSDLSPANPILREYLESTFGSAPGQTDSFVASPVFEAKFGFTEDSRTMTQFAELGFLNQQLIQNMDQPPADLMSQRFAKAWHPYVHQVQAWEALINDNASIVVSAGTGSGKTECFLVPILHHLANKLKGKASLPLVGVEALFLYPLNALINSQRERLSAWISSWNGSLRYCLYNGETQQSVKQAEQKATPERILSRTLLRKEPPPILVTNATMLEYMLVRPEDQSILERSQGTLKYIVLDEAHTYVGSQAAEMALLLRRVMNAFGVEPKDVQFIATSATIASSKDDSSRDPFGELQEFMAALAGQPIERIKVITGGMQVPPLPQTTINEALPDLGALESATPRERFQALSSASVPRKLREIITERGPQTLASLNDSLSSFPPLDSMPPSKRTDTILRILDLGHIANQQNEKKEETDSQQTFLPLRGHVFARTQPGVWACANGTCSGRKNTPLNSDAWPFGRVYTSFQQICDDCRSHVYEVTLCFYCGGEFLQGSLEHREGDNYFSPHKPNLDDSEEPDDALSPESEEEEAEIFRSGLCIVGLHHSKPESECELLDPATGLLGGDSGQRVEVEHFGSGETPRCPRCNQSNRSSFPLFVSFRNSGQFVLNIAVPTLLEMMPPISGASNTLPFSGRRTITFTDSRQGTARFSSRLQNEAERNFVRSFIYNYLWANAQPDSAKISELEVQLGQLYQAQEQLGAGAHILDAQVTSIEQQLEQAQAPQRVRLVDIVQELSADNTLNWIYSRRKLYEPFNLTSRQLAELLVIAEFARRPMRRKSLETMGLVAIEYSFLQELSRQTPPTWRAWGGDEKEWGDFLKICLDFFVRSNVALNSPQELYRWMGTQIRPTFIRPPDELEKLPTNARKWPSVSGIGSRSRLVRLLLSAFARLEAPTDLREELNDLLHAAWHAIAPKLTQTADGRRLNMVETVELRVVQKAFRCPLTRQILDTTLRKQTPYQPSTTGIINTVCQEIDLPSPLAVFGERPGTSQTVLQTELHNWLLENPQVRELRQHGLWSEQHDRLVESQGRRYFQVAEHSAQLSSKRLQIYEDMFKKGNINVLSCSTTMEMGVDIGGLAGVAMNNAPPGPANFLQRSGRAGRRGENAAVSLTVCRSLPHDQAIFRNPLWPFVTPMFVTDVRLDSERIVQRHVNAYCLTHFLARWGTADGPSIPRLQSSWFFRAEEGASPFEQFLAFLGEEPLPTPFTRGLENLVRGSALQHHSRELTLDYVRRDFCEARDKYQLERSALEQQLAALEPKERENSPTARAINHQLRRIDGDYLLSFLSTHQCLPGYGFPTGVIPFITTTAEELAAQRKQHNNDGGEGRPMQSRGFPSRGLSMAIREYAPGAEIVIDGVVYRSEGVTLNWHLPPESGESNLSEIQALRAAWRCRSCGAVGAALSTTIPTSCSECGGVDLRQMRFLQPAGFAVDLFTRTSAHSTHAPYIPVFEPWLSSGYGPWNTLGSPRIVEFRHASDGAIIQLNRGPNGKGYAICLRCGRAAPESNDPDPHLPPQELQNHRRLRGGRGYGVDGTGDHCIGNAESFSTRRQESLGGDTHTDVFELRLFDPQTNQPLHDTTVATSIAVALRQALAEQIGIEDRELGYGVAHRQQDNLIGASIFLYDTASGGAGFCAQAPRLLPQLLRHTREILECEKNCDAACHHCLLAFDTQHDLNNLNRHSALNFLSSEWLQGLQLAEEFRCFGESTTVEWQSPQQGLLRLARRHQLEELRLLFQGDLVRWDWIEWWQSVPQELKQLLPRLTLVLTEEQLQGLDWNQIEQLANLLDFTNPLQLATIREFPPEVLEAPHLFAELITTQNAVYAFATTDPEILAPERDWLSNLSGALTLFGQTDRPVFSQLQSQSAEQLRARAPSLPNQFQRFTIKHELDGGLKQIGNHFWSWLVSQSPEISSLATERGPATSIRYEDRYVRNPLNVGILFRLMMALKSRALLNSNTTLDIRTSWRTPQGPSTSISSDWRHQEQQEKVLDLLFEHVVKNSTNRSIKVLGQNELNHARTLELGWGGSSKLVFQLDQGVGFLKPRHYPPQFPFDEDATRQAVTLYSADWELKNKGQHVYIFVCTD